MCVLVRHENVWRLKSLKMPPPPCMSTFSHLFWTFCIKSGPFCLLFNHDKKVGIPPFIWKISCLAGAWCSFTSKNVVYTMYMYRMLVLDQLYFGEFFLEALQQWLGYHRDWQCETWTDEGGTCFSIWFKYTDYTMYKQTNLVKY